MGLCNSTPQSKATAANAPASKSKEESNFDAEAFIQKEVNAHEVVIWSKSYCTYCNRTKAIFEQPEFSKVDVFVYELNENLDGFFIQDTLAEKTGQRTVPSVWVNGEFIGGNDKMQKLLAKGELKKKLGL